MNKKQLLSYALGPVGTGLLALGTVPLVAWFFSPADVGRLYVLQTVIAFAVIVVFLGLDQAYVREFHETTDAGSLLRATFLPAAALLTVVVLAALPFSSTISVWLFESSEPTFVWVTLGCALCAFVSRQLSLILRMEERAFTFSLSQLLPKLIFVVLVAAVSVLSVEPSFLGLALSLLIASASVMLALVWSTRATWNAAVRARGRHFDLSKLLRFGLPLMLASLAYWGLTATSAFMLRGLSDLTQVGIYSVSMSVAGIAAIFQTIFTVIWAPLVYKWVATGTDISNIERVSRQALVVVVAVLSCGGMMSWSLEFVLPSEYSTVQYLFLCTVIQPLLYTLSEITGIGIAVTRRTAFSLWTTLLALATNIALNVLLIPALGAAGAVIANALSFAVFFIGRTEASARVWRPVPRLRIYLVVLSGVAMSVLTVLVGSQLGYWIVVVWALYGVFFLTVMRADVRALLALVRRR
ncbi:lipopolysaccharide biosynthesis protein [Leifsonia sp. A12D58]|uniref:lipopolysaccharide biosynthesis protein n=1 Tax=Leifsonia sp. A12D58 TaxID=3397674 RepID=UPI0039E1D9D7